ncbi:UNVERIFIED_CONTAM: hypothetical protein FKN15_021426 [Acipenser sinensis]
MKLSVKKRPSSDQESNTAPGSVLEDSTVPELTKSLIPKRPRLQDFDLLSLTFPQKLWKITGSASYKSITWNHEGNLVMIDESLFKVIQGASGPFRAFETDSMKRFICQLSLHSFTKIRQGFDKTATGKEEPPQRSSQSAGECEVRITGVFPNSTTHNKQACTARSLQQEAPSTGDTFSQDQGSQAGADDNADTSNVAQGNTAGDPEMTGNVLTHFFSACTSYHASEPGSASTSVTASAYNFVPPVQPPGATMCCPGLPYPDCWLPFCNPWFSMPMMAAASAFSMSGSLHHHQALPHHHHCTNCNCTSPSGPPSTRGAPKNPEYMWPNKSH